MVESNFLSPTLQGDVRPQETRQVINPVGPLNAGPGVEQLLPAVNPGVASQAPRERGLQVDRSGPTFADTLANVSRIVSGVGGIIGTIDDISSSFGKSEEEKKNERLRPLVERFNTLREGIDQGSVTGGVAQANVFAREYLANYPSDVEEIRTLFKSVFDRDLGSGGVPDPQAEENEALTKWLESPIGINASIASNAYKTPEERNAYLYQSFVEDINKQAELARTSQVLSTIQGTEAIQDAADRELGRRILPSQTTLANDFAIGVLTGAKEGDFDLDTINGLNQKRAELALQFRSEYISAGVPVALHEQYLNESLSAIDNVIAMVEGNAEALNKMVGFLGDKGTARLQTMIAEMNDPVLSAIAGSREGMGYFIESLIRTEDANIQIAVANMRERARAGNEIIKGSELETPTAADTFDQGVLDRFRNNREAAQEAFRTGALIMEDSDMTTNDGISNAYLSLTDMMAASVASDQAISYDAFQRGFAAHVDKINLILSDDDVVGQNLTQSLNAFTSDQLLRHRTVFEDSVNALPSGFFIQYDGTTVTLGFDREAFDKADNDLTNRVKYLLKEKGLAPTVENINNVIANSRGIIRDSASTPRGLLSDSTEQPAMGGYRYGPTFGNMKTAWDSMTQSLNTINAVTQFALDIPNIADNYTEGLELILEDQTNAANFIGGLTTEEEAAIEQRWSNAKTFQTEEDYFVAAEQGQITVGEPIIVNGVRYYAEFEE